MYKFTNNVYAIANLHTKEIVAPFKTPYGVWFRAFYDTKKGANLALTKLKETVEYLKNKCVDEASEQRVKERYGFTKESLEGVFYVIELSKIDIL